METEIVYLSLFKMVNGSPEITMAKVRGVDYQGAYDECKRRMEDVLAIKAKRKPSVVQLQFPFMSEDVGI